MKVILSRKGFDSSNGGCPSPIMPDGTLLSMPIPSVDRDSYDDLCYNGMPYSRILQQLAPKKTFGHCHVDPDIRDECRASHLPWKDDRKNGNRRNHRAGSSKRFCIVI